MNPSHPRTNTTENNCSTKQTPVTTKSHLLNTCIKDKIKIKQTPAQHIRNYRADRPLRITSPKGNHNKKPNKVHNHAIDALAK